MQRSSRTHQRGGYVLVIVLGLSMVALSTGIAYIESQGTVLPEAVNRMAAVRARYLTESGVELAIHYLMYPPKTVKPGHYFRGAAAQRIDSSNDYFTVSVLKDASVEGQYKIQCKGIALDHDGDVRGAHYVEAVVLVAPAEKLTVPYALMCGGRVALNANDIFIGDLHADGDIDSTGYCDGNVSATGSVSWKAGAPASITENAPSVGLPGIAPSEFFSYVIDGVEYQALAYPNDAISTANAMNIESFLSSQPNNPGRVIYCNSGNTIQVDAGVRIRGTLVAERGVEFVGSGNHQIIPVDHFPALVTAGRISANDDGTVVELSGVVFCNEFESQTADNINMFVNGALVVSSDDGVRNGGGTDSLIIVQWYGAKATVYNLANTRDQRPATILSWKEN